MLIDIDAEGSTPPVGYLRLNYLKQGLGFRDPNGVNRRLKSVPAVTVSTPVTTGTITPLAFVDETNYITPAGTLAALNYVLPSGEYSIVGQIKRFQSSATITALTVTVAGSGTVAGTATTAMVIGTTYEWQCIAITGAGVATWLRIR